jgi:hypothetical protein
LKHHKYFDRHKYLFFVFADYQKSRSTMASEAATTTDIAIDIPRKKPYVYSLA